METLIHQGIPGIPDDLAFFQWKIHYSRNLWAGNIYIYIYIFIYLFIYLFIFGGVLKQIQGYSWIFYILISRPSAASLSVAIVMREMILIAQFDHQFYAKCVSTYPLVN